MKTSTETKPSIDHLIHLPRYAQYLLEQRLDDLTSAQMLITEEVEIPLLRFFKELTYEQLFQLTRNSAAEFLTCLSQNKTREYIDKSLTQWKANLLPVVKKEDIDAADITMITYLRKKSLISFIADYTSDINDAVEIIKEIDLFLSVSETLSTNTYIELLQNKISDDTLLIEKVNQTIPGAVYVFDVENFKGIYSNKKLPEIIGYSHSELNQIGEDALGKLLHPEDSEAMFQHIESLKTARDGEIKVFKYRVKDKSGHYRWLSNHESVFKRDAEGKVIQTIGITLDIDKEEATAGALRENEYLYKKAEEITHLGSYKWDLVTNQLLWSDEMYAIYGLNPGKDSNEFGYISSFNYPEDTEMVRSEYTAAISNKRPFDFDYRIVAKDGKHKILHARGEVITNENNEPVIAIGTVLDVTEKQTLIKKLKENESIYKQAEELANMGNWSWDIKTNRIEWTDHLYKIYGLEPQSEEITMDRFLNFVHPEDRAYVSRGVDETFSQERLDYTFRIITADRKIKHLRSVAQVQRDEKGQPVFVIGTERDITEKQNLIGKLTRSEQLYKQAQALAHVGNWSWDVQNNRIEWSDELYRIYGLDPSSGELTYEKYLSLLHPDDRDMIVKNVQTTLESGKPYEFTHRLITTKKELKTVYATGEALKDEKGKVYMLVGTAQDITERQHLIDQLQESEKLYKQAQALAKLGNFAWNLSANEVIWSDEVYRIYELPLDTPVRFESAFEPILDEYKPSVRQMIEATISQKTGHSVTYPIKVKKGIKYLNLETDVILDEKENVVRIIGTAQDITERQLLLERLQDSEKHFKQAQSLARIGNWTMDIKTKEFTWSDEMYNIYELSKDEHFNFEKWLDHLMDDREEIIAYYEDCLKNHNTYDKIHRIRLTNGKIKVIHRKAEFTYDNNGQPLRMIGTTQDITDEYRTQQELKDNQTFIRKITDATPSIIASYNVNTGKYVFISEGLEKLLGYDTNEVMEKGVQFFAGIMHPADMEEVMKKNAAVLEEANADTDKNDIVAEFTYRMKHKDGGWRWFHTYGTIFDRNNQRKVEHVLNISLDVTEQVEASEKIKEQEHFIQQLADASPTILYLFDVKKQSFGYINREIFFVLGYLPDEILSWKEKVTDKLYHPEDHHLLPARKQSSKNFLQADSMIQYECRMKNNENEWRWLLVREIVFKTDEDGNVLQILGAALDINRRKEMERTILQNTLLLEQSNASLEEFAYVASHDLKEPLRKISTFGDRLMASQANNLTDDGKIYLNKIVDASQRMQTMISDLLSISMISNNTSFEKYSLEKLKEEVVQTLEFKIEQQHALIESDLLPEADIIPSQFRQLFQNLLSNSLKFVRPGVQPVVKIKHSVQTPKEVSSYQLAQAPRYHRLEFIDNGIGFENEFAGKIFAIFQRLHGRSEYEGSGIGLAICKKIVEHHGGVIYASGVPEQGATFTIILPAS